MRPVLAVLVAAAVLVLVGGVAAAHANYVKSNPASDARLTKSPAEVRVTFSEPPDPRHSDIAVLDAGGRRLDRRDVAAATDEADTLRVSVPPLPEGGYLVSWTVVSAVDAHETKGAFAFAVGSAPLPGVPDIPLTPPPTALELLGRALSFAGVASLIGAPFFLLFAHAPQQDRERRRERRLLAVAGILLLTGALVTLASYGATLPSRVLLVLAARALLGASAVALLFVPRLGERTRRQATALVGLAAGLTLTLVSHAAASGAPLQIALDITHVIAVSVWSGGTLTLLAMATAVPFTPRALGDMVWRFSLTALVAVCVIVLTGTLQSLSRLVLVWDLLETPYGLALLAKLILFAVLLALGALNLLVWGPRLRRGTAAGAALVGGVAAETVVFIGVIAAAAYLTAAAPPAQQTAAAFDQTQRVDGIRVELLASSTIPGRDRFLVRVHQGLAAVDAEKVALRFTMVEHDMGTQELVATERAPGEYSAEGSPMAMFGTWHVETIVRIAGRQDVRARFTVPVSAPQGQGAAAKVLSAPPYTLIVFADPPRPQAGAPLTIGLVATNEKGDPATGLTITAALAGPSRLPAIEARPDRTAPGRYTVALDGLDAGRWQAAISVGGKLAGEVELEVAR